MQARNHGFSLVEVVVALGVISFALVAIIGVFPVAMKSATDSRRETKAAFIAESVINQLKAQSPTRTSLAMGPDPTSANTLTGNKTINLQSNLVTWVIYDEDGFPLRTATSAQYENAGLSASVAKSAGYQMRLTIAGGVPTTGVSQATIEVSYPANAPLTNRTVNTFATYLSNID